MPELQSYTYDPRKRCYVRAGEPSAVLDPIGLNRIQRIRRVAGYSIGSLILLALLLAGIIFLQRQVDVSTGPIQSIELR